MSRHLTRGEIQLLQPVFVHTLRYEAILCKINEWNIGGANNSITPSGTVQFSRLVYCEDFSMANPFDQRHFVHEITHAWQWGHGVYPVYAALGILVKKRGHYEKGYDYDLNPGQKLSDFNIEQQASIVADYWGLKRHNLRPEYNNNDNGVIDDYSALIAELQRSGPPISKSDIPI